MENFNYLLTKLTDELQRRHMTIATAESCTGGMIASFLTELPGSSVWFDRGFVTYSNEAKHEMLGVDSELIRLQGAVSQVVAESMALGALQFSNANVSLSVTGIAGPDGGSKEKPVGVVFFAYALRGHGVQSDSGYFPNSTRQEIRLLTCRHALQGMLTMLGELS